MFDRTISSRLAATTLLVASGLTACDVAENGPVGPDLAVVDAGRPDAQAIEVYSQNVFLGGDTGPLFTLDLNDIPAVLTATNAFWVDVQQSAVPERMAEIADEIAASGPHVVGLEEVFRFVTLDGSFQPTGGIDLLAALEAEIAARGLPYTTEVVQEGTSSALPLAVDFSTGSVTRWLSFTDRVVILRRDDVVVTDESSGTYAASLSLGPLEVKRAWARVSLERAGVPHHVVATHLESQALLPIHNAQASELLSSVVAGLDGVTIITGDLNSDAVAGPGDPSWTPTYGNLLAAGFADVWELAPHSRTLPGYTCCQDPTLRNGTSELDQRIDLILVRSADYPIPEDGFARGFYRFDVVGDEVRDRTQSGLWPSDHAGIVARIRPLSAREGS